MNEHDKADQPNDEQNTSSRADIAPLPWSRIVVAYLGSWVTIIVMGWLSAGLAIPVLGLMLFGAAAVGLLSAWACGDHPRGAMASLFIGSLFFVTWLLFSAVTALHLAALGLVDHGTLVTAELQSRFDAGYVRLTAALFVLSSIGVFSGYMAAPTRKQARTMLDTRAKG